MGRKYMVLDTMSGDMLFHFDKEAAKKDYQHALETIFGQHGEKAYLFELIKECEAVVTNKETEYSPINDGFEEGHPFGK